MKHFHRWIYWPAGLHLQRSCKRCGIRQEMTYGKWGQLP